MFILIYMTFMMHLKEMTMKKLLYLVAVAGLSVPPSYGMEKSADQKQQNECKDCIKVGPCKWAHLAAQLGGMQAGNSLQQISAPTQAGEKESDIKSPASTVTHSSEAADDDASEAGSLHSWDKPGLPNDDDWVDWDKWDDVDAADKEKKE
jgi:hypothetical protein